MEKRVVANLAHDGHLNYGDGINGTWIRPDDIEYYKDFIDTIEFFSQDKQQEQALYRIYAEQHGWGGNLTDIIFNLDTPAINTLVPPSFGLNRLNCKQKCTENKCKHCYYWLKLADPKKLKGVQDNG